MAGGLTAVGTRFKAALLAQRGQGLCWIPVCLGLGIGTYFSLLREPAALWFAAIGAVALVLGLAARKTPEAYSQLLTGAMICLLGFLIAGARAHLVAGPVLDWRYYGPIEGRVVAMDRSQSDALRLTLDRVRLDRVAPHRTPARVRISLHGNGGISPKPGQKVMTTGHLSPPSGPVEPGGFDFQRHAWFARLGAVGYTRTPLLAATDPQDGYGGLIVFRLRMAAAARIRTHLSGDIGGFAVAVTTGDRSAIGKDALEALRASNLAHLLAISGLHMGLLTAVVFGALRLILSALPGVALRWPTKGIAAVGALIAAVGYLALSGGNVATQRAFVMVAVALGALILGRRALSLRAVAVAATLVLVLRPEALMGPGFQMSFAATTALVVVFGLLRKVESDRVPRPLRPALGVLVSSAVAGLATAPIAAAHFNTIAHYGLIANLLSVPLMGVLVIPAAVLALVLAPFGLEGLGLWATGLGLRWILGVADWVAQLDGARSFVPGPGGWVLPLLALGFLVLALWQGRARWSGLGLVAAAFMLWTQTERPVVLIAEKGTLVGWMTPEGRALSKAKAAGFVARNWLENDGDGATQFDAAARGPAPGPASKVIHLSGKRAVAAVTQCSEGQIFVASTDAQALRDMGCRVIDPGSLRRTGSLALFAKDQGWVKQSARARAGDRPWTHWPDNPPDRDQYVRIKPTSRP